MTRKQKLMDLMRYRTTIAQGLTLRQIFGEVYPDIVEEYHDKQMINQYGDPIGSELDELYHFKYKKYLRKTIRQIRESNDEFRWLSIVPWKDEEGKLRQYIHVNIRLNNPESEELLSEVNAFWFKHAQACIDGLQRAIDAIDYIKEVNGWK